MVGILGGIVVVLRDIVLVYFVFDVILFVCIRDKVGRDKGVVEFGVK